MAAEAVVLAHRTQARAQVRPLALPGAAIPIQTLVLDCHSWLQAQVLKIYELLAQRRPGMRHRIEHLALPTPDQLARLALHFEVFRGVDAHSLATPKVLG